MVEEDKTKIGEVQETVGERKISVLKESKETLEGLKEEHEKIKKTIGELKETTAENILSGTPDKAPKEEKKEISDKDYAEAAMRGVILE